MLRASLAGEKVEVIAEDNSGEGKERSLSKSIIDTELMKHVLQSYKEQQLCREEDRDESSRGTPEPSIICFAQ